MAHETAPATHAEKLRATEEFSTCMQSPVFIGSTCWVLLLDRHQVPDFIASILQTAPPPRPTFRYFFERDATVYIFVRAIPEEIHNQYIALVIRT